MTNEKLINGGIKKILFMFLTTLCLLFCIYHPASAASAKTSIKVMTVGETCTVKKASLVKSSKNNVASVTKIGGSKYKVNILKKGKSTIKVYDKNGKLTKKIYLLAANNKSFNYDSTALYLRKGSSKIVKASSNISGVTVKYASSDESVATVDSAGRITAKKAGTSTIRARFYYKGECVRKINKKVDVYTSSYSTTSISITAGNTKSVAPTVSSNCTVSYSSSDSSVASVNSKGVLTAKKKGTATVTTKVSVNGTPVKTYTIKVTVKAKSSSSSSSSSETEPTYTLSKSSISIDKQGTATLRCLTNGSFDSSTLVYSWSSSDPSIVAVGYHTVGNMVYQQYPEITMNAKKTSGSATITCTLLLKDGTRQSLTCKVTVTSGVVYIYHYYLDAFGGGMASYSYETINGEKITYLTNDKFYGGNSGSLKAYSDKASDVYTFKTSNDCIETKEVKTNTEYDSDLQITEYYTSLPFTARKKGDCVISVYRNGTLVQKLTVTVATTDDDYYEYEAWRKGLEEELWTSEMSCYEKILTFGDYVFARYPYNSECDSAYGYSMGIGADCWGSSQLLVDVAHDLGLEAETYYTNGLTYGHRMAKIYLDDGRVWICGNSASGNGSYGNVYGYME